MLGAGPNFLAAARARPFESVYLDVRRTPCHRRDIAILPEPRGMDGSTGRLDGITLHERAQDIAAVIEALCDGAIMVIRLKRVRQTHRSSPRLGSPGAGQVVGAPVVQWGRRASRHRRSPRRSVWRSVVNMPADIRAEAVRAGWLSLGSDIAPWIEGWSQPRLCMPILQRRRRPADDWWTAGAADVLIVQGLVMSALRLAMGRSLCSEIGDRATPIRLAYVGHALPVENLSCWPTWW